VTLVNDHDRDTLYRKRKAITALFPYAAWQERDNQCGILGVFLDAAKTSRSAGFLWHHIEPFFATLLSGASHVSLKRAATLASPYFLWWSRSCCFKKDKAQAAQAWVTTASAVPREKEIAPSAVDVLLQIAHLGLLQPNHSEVWSWLTLQPSLPPICEGRRLGSDSHVVQTIRNLKDIEILKSYLVLIWSEWNSLRSGFPEMCNSIPEDFGGIEMYSHRGDLMQRLDHVLGHLDRGLAHLRYERPNTHVIDLQKRKDQYGELRTILLETDRKTLEILTRMSSGLVIYLNPPTPVYAYRIPLDVHVCAPYPVSVVGCPGHLVLVPPSHTIHALVWIPAMLLSPDSPCAFHCPKPIAMSSTTWTLVADGRLSIERYSCTFCSRDLYSVTRFRFMYSLSPSPDA